MKYLTTIMLLFFSTFSAMSMENLTLFDHAYNGNYQVLKNLVRPDNVNACDEQGNSLYMHAVVGVFAHRKYDNFQSLMTIFKNNNLNFDAPVHSDSLVSNIGFVANTSLNCKNVKPLQIVLEQGANPFLNTYSIYEHMLALAMDNQPYAFHIAGLMAQNATNLHDAAKSVCLTAMAKHVSVKSVNDLDAKQRSPLFYLIQYGSLAPKNDLLLAVKLLKETGADLNADIPHISKKNYTYMHFATTVAALSKNANVIEAMLQNGGSPQAGCGLSLITPSAMAKKMQKQIPFYKNILEIFNNYLDK